MGIALPPMPTVHPWMIASHVPVMESAQVFTAASKEVDDAGKTLQTMLGEAGGVLGWQSAGAQSARVPMVQAHTEVGMLRDIAGRAAMSLHSLGRSMEEYGGELKKLKTRREELTFRAGVYHNEAGGDDEDVVTGMLEDARQLDTQIVHFVDLLARADRATRDDLDRVADDLTTLGATDREDEWVGDMAPPEIVALLGRYGVTETADERGLLDKIMLLPDGPAGDEELRKLLATMTPEELADFLLRHPDVARRLIAAPLGPPGSYPPGSPEDLLAIAIAAGKNLPPKDAVKAIQSVFAALSPEQRQRLALLYPNLVGNLNGAPLDLRMAANRVQIGVALDDERAKQVDTTRALAFRTPEEVKEGKENNRVDGPLWKDVDDPDSEARRNARRLEYYQELLYGDVEQPGPKKDGKNDPHQVLYFDPSGDGQIAEMWGDLDAARNVAVFVPGTMTDMENFEQYSDDMKALAEKDPSGQTVAITWLGTDMPDAVRDAPDTKYAEAGGPKFRDFVFGLDVPPEKRVTAIGHSYGGLTVGTADREGLEVDAVVHVASSGTGKGVTSGHDYPDGVAGKERYSLTAPGDLIEFAQGDDNYDVVTGDHGSDPDETEGFTQLETGRYYAFAEDPSKNGQMIGAAGAPWSDQEGHVAAHEDVVKPGTTAFDNIYGVVTGGEVIPEVYRQPYEEDPYEDPAFDGRKKDIPDDAGR
jgi:hypothetical protein